jgi:hypothetical protein
MVSHSSICIDLPYASDAGRHLYEVLGFILTNDMRPLLKQGRGLKLGNATCEERTMKKTSSSGLKEQRKSRAFW